MIIGDVVSTRFGLFVIIEINGNQLRGSKLKDNGIMNPRYTIGLSKRDLYVVRTKLTYKI